MKDFIKWLFTTKAGASNVVYWIGFYILFVWQGFKQIADSAVNGDMAGANAYYHFAMGCIVVLSLMTAGDFNKRAK